MNLKERLLQRSKKNAEAILGWIERIKKGEKINVIVRTPRGEPVRTITKKSFKALSKDFPKIYQWLGGKKCEILEYDIQEIKESPDYDLFKDYFNFLPALIAYDSYGFLWENEREYSSLEQAYSWFEEFLASWLSERMEYKKHIISIASFVKEAHFGPVQLDMTKTEIENLFGRPEIYITPCIFGYKKALEWKYAWIEFHFGPESEKLEAIHIHHTQNKQSFQYESRAFELTDIFFFDGERPLTIKELERKLLDANIDFSYFILEEYGDLKVRLENDIQIYFDENKDGLYIPSSLVLARPSSVEERFWSPTRLD